MLLENGERWVFWFSSNGEMAAMEMKTEEVGSFFSVEGAVLTLQALLTCSQVKSLRSMSAKKGSFFESRVALGRFLGVVRREKRRCLIFDFSVVLVP